MNRENDIWAVILAAGESRRMKQPKLILPYRGTTLLGHVISNVTCSAIKGAVVVTGAWKEEVEYHVKSYPVKLAFNKDYRSGMLSSVKCGIVSLPGSAKAAVIMPADIPGIDTRTINILIDARGKSEKGIFIATFGGKRGHPILVDRKYFNNIVMIESSKGLCSLSEQFADDVFEVETHNPLILKDIDTPDDYSETIIKS